MTYSTQAVLDVISERTRQIAREGFTTEHDDSHDGGELAAAGAAYACNAAEHLHPYSLEGGQNKIPIIWPWDDADWKPTTPRRDLVKAAALILAEIERIDRSEGSKT